MQKKVYIVLVNYKGHNDTIECLESILKSGYADYQVLVVDNSPDSSSLDVLLNWANGAETTIETALPQFVLPVQAGLVEYANVNEDGLNRLFTEKIVFIKAAQNNGFAAANNVALCYISKFAEPGQVVWVLNNDTVIEPHVLGAVAGVSGQATTLYGTPLLEYYEPGVVQVVGGKYNYATGLSSHVGEGLSVKVITNEYISSQEIDYPVGASIILQKEFLDTVGLMEEDYFLYYEELDWSFRAHNAGGKVVILPISGVYHKQGKALVNKKEKQKPEFIDLTFIRSRLKFARKFNKDNYRKVVFSVLTLTIGKRLLQGNFKIIPKIIRLLRHN